MSAGDPLLADPRPVDPQAADHPVHLHERQQEISRIVTTDRRHFALIRPRHCKAFNLLP